MALSLNGCLTDLGVQGKFGCFEDLTLSLPLGRKTPSNWPDRYRSLAVAALKRGVLPPDDSAGGIIEPNMPTITVTIEPSTCILAANCVGMEPKLFQIGSEPYVELIDASGKSKGTEYTFEATDAEIEMVEEAVDSCPTRAITMMRV
jgi:ferredoxin